MVRRSGADRDHEMSRFAVLTLVVGLTGACKSEESSAPLCVPGEAVACPCPAVDTQGVQACADDGQSFYACDCGGITGSGPWSDGGTSPCGGYCAPQNCCDGECVDIMNDPENCGSCGQFCAEAASGGKCRFGECFSKNVICN